MNIIPSPVVGMDLSWETMPIRPFSVTNKLAIIPPFWPNRLSQRNGGSAFSSLYAGTMATIYLSATYEDLKDYRRLVFDTFQEARQGMRLC